MYTREVKSAGGVVVNKKGEVLVVNQHHTSWSLPKGHIEKGEDPLTAARREIFEESGVKNLTFIKKLPSYSRYKIGQNGSDDLSELKHIEMFLFRTNEEPPAGGLSPHDPGNPEARFVEKEKAVRLLTHPKDREFFQKILFELE